MVDEIVGWHHWPKEIQPVNSKGHQSWVFFGRNDAKAETPVLWPPHAKSWLIGKDSDAWRDWGQEEKGTTEDEMAGWHHWLDGCESEWTLGVGDRQGGLECRDSWGRKESDTTEQLNWTERVLLPPELLKLNSWYLPLNHYPHQVGPILVSKYLKSSTSPRLLNAKPWIEISIIIPNLSHRMHYFSTTHPFFL